MGNFNDPYYMPDFPRYFKELGVDRKYHFVRVEKLFPDVTYYIKCYNHSKRRHEYLTENGKIVGTEYLSRMTNRELRDRYLWNDCFEDEKEDIFMEIYVRATNLGEKS